MWGIVWVQLVGLTGGFLEGIITEWLLEAKIVYATTLSLYRMTEPEDKGEMHLPVLDAKELCRVIHILEKTEMCYF